MQTRLDTPGEGDAILSHSPTLWDNPSNIHCPQPGKSLFPETPHARGKHQQVLGLKQPEEKPSFWEMAADSKGRQQGRAANPCGFVSARHCPRPGIISCCRKGREVALEDPTKKGNVLGWAPPCPDLQLFLNHFFQRDYWQPGQRGKAKGFTFPTLMEKAIKQSPPTSVVEIPISLSSVRTREKSILQLQNNQTFRNRH